MKKALFILFFLPLLAVSCYAEGVGGQAGDEIGILAVEDAAPEKAKEITGNLDVSFAYDGRGALERMSEKAVQKLKEEIRSSITAVSGVLAVSFLSATAAALTDNKTAKECISVVSCCAAALMLLNGINSITDEACRAMQQMSDYSKAALPAVYTAAAVCGAAISASARYAASCLAIDVIMSAGQRLIIPLIYSYLALSVANGLFGNSVVKSCARTVKWAAVMLMSVISIVFCAAIAMSGIVTASSDAVAIRTAKTVLSTSLPVVGGILSDAAASVLSAAGIIKNSAGVFGLLVICAICLGPFIALSVRVMVLNAVSAITEVSSDKRLSSMLNDIGTAAGMMLGLLGCCGIMMFVSFMSAIKAVAI